MFAQPPYIRIAQILRPQGVKGAVKAQPLSPGAWRYEHIQEFFLNRGTIFEQRTMSINPVSGGFLHVQFEGVADRDAAEKLRGAYIGIKREQAPPLNEGEYYTADLIGCDVMAGADRLGALEDILDTNGAADVYAVRTQKGRLLFPALSRVVESVDVAQRRITVDAAALGEVSVYED